MKLYNIRAMFFNRGSAEPWGSASGCRGLRRTRPKLPGMKLTTTVLCGQGRTQGGLGGWG